jgi:ketosteroid isomerase-like protein
VTVDTRDLVTGYIQAVGEGRLGDLPAMLAPDVEFTVGDSTLRGPEAFVAAFERLAPILVRNDIRHAFVDGNQACVIYDFVTDSPAGAVVSVELIKVVDGRIASVLLVFERLHWPEVLAELAARGARRATPASA